jgi:acetolactate synthase-1/2/3 large subunit
MEITVSKLIVRYLERLGIQYIFGIPGAHILPVYDELYDSSLKCILTKHEQGAAYMAIGYSRVSKKIGACITTAGPGATNLITGIASAYVDKIPLIAITAEAPTYLFGKGGLQECSGEGGSIDQDVLFKGISRYNKVVERTDYLLQVLRASSKALLSQESGPVALSFPFNVQKEKVDESILDYINTERREATYDRDEAGLINRMAAFINKSTYPVIVAGYGCIASGAGESLVKLCTCLNIPVTTSVKGRGIIPESADISLGSLGVTSNGLAYEYIAQKADLIIFLGVSFNERTSYLWDKKLLSDKKIIQVDNDYNQLEKVFQADLPIKKDIKQVIEGVQNKVNCSSDQKKTLELVLHFKKQQKTYFSHGKLSHLKKRFSLIQYFFKKLEENFQENIMIFDDNIIFAQNFYHVLSSKSYFSNSGISSLGNAIPAAIGARFFQNKPTFAIIGDGGFHMCCMEIMTAVNYNLPITIVLFNNSTLGLIRKNQYQHYNGRLLCNEFINPHFQYLAQSFGIAYKKILTHDHVDEVFHEMDFSNSINLIEIVLDKDTFPDYLVKR